MLTVLTVAGLVLLILVSMAGIVWVIGSTDFFSYCLFGHQAVEALFKLIGYCVLALVDTIGRK